MNGKRRRERPTLTPVCEMSALEDRHGAQYLRGVVDHLEVFVFENAGPGPRFGLWVRAPKSELQASLLEAAKGNGNGKPEGTDRDRKIHSGSPKRPNALAPENP